LAQPECQHAKKKENQNNQISTDAKENSEVN